MISVEAFVSNWNLAAGSHALARVDAAHLRSQQQRGPTQMPVHPTVNLNLIVLDGSQVTTAGLHINAHHDRPDDILEAQRGAMTALVAAVCGCSPDAAAATAEQTIAHGRASLEGEHFYFTSSQSIPGYAIETFAVDWST